MSGSSMLLVDSNHQAVHLGEIRHDLSTPWPKFHQPRRTSATHASDQYPPVPGQMTFAGSGRRNPWYS